MLYHVTKNKKRSVSRGDGVTAQLPESPPSSVYISFILLLFFHKGSSLLKTAAGVRESAGFVLVPGSLVSTEGQRRHPHVKGGHSRGTLSSGALLFAPEGDGMSPKAVCCVFPRVQGMLW